MIKIATISLWVVRETFSVVLVGWEFVDFTVN